jgi:hypothetical protein
MQVTDTVRAVHTAGAIRRAFFATVLSVQPSLPDDIGTNGEPTITIGFLDPAMLHMVGGVGFGNAFRRITTVRHVSHDEVQTSAAEYCWTDLLPNDGGIIVIASLNMDDLNEPAAQPSEPEDTIGTIVYINHNNDLEVFHGGENMFRVHFEGEDFDFSDLFSAKVFVDAKPAASIEGSPRDLLGHQMFGEDSEEVAKARYEIHKKQLQAAEPLFTGVFDRGEALGPERFAAVSNGVTIWNYATRDEAQSYLEKYQAGNAPPQPSAADLDAHAAEDQAKEATETPGFQKVADDAAALHAAPEVPTELAIETKVYTDGTTATGVAPLPEQSPAQQDAEQLPPDSPDPLAAL